jgi:nucleoside-diphosphate-sugar epimerase
MYKKINNLVLGSEGFVGKYFCEFLVRNNESVVNFDIDGAVPGDCRIDKLPLDNIDRVYFLAWDVGGAKYLYKTESQYTQLDWNLRILLNVMPQIKSAGIPMLFASSQLAQEYDTVYGSTKRLGEVWTKLLGGVSVRFWNVYGPLENISERSHVISDFIHQAINAKKISMLTTGFELRQFVHVEDVSRAMQMAMNQELTGIYDITSFEWVSIYEIAEMIGALLDVPVIRGLETGRTPTTPLTGKIPMWLPTISIEKGLMQMIDVARGC